MSNTLGSGFLEKVYENAVAHQLIKDGMKIEQQRPIKVYYDDVVVGEYFADLVAERAVIVELKASKRIEDVYLAQTLNLKFHRNSALFDHPTIRNSASTKDFRGSFCFLLQTALKSSLNAALAMICLKSEKAKLLRPLTLCLRSGMFWSRVA